jgi:hypothetical protein
MVRFRWNLATLANGIMQRVECDLGALGKLGGLIISRWLQALYGLDHTRRDFVAVIVYPYLDHFKTADELVTLLPVFHKLDGRYDIVRGIPLDRDLRVDGANERAMSSRPGSLVAAMMHDDNGAIESVSNRIGSFDIRTPQTITATNSLSAVA